MFLDTITIHELIIVIVSLLILVVFLIVAILLFSLYKYNRFQNKIKWTEFIEHKITDTIIDGGHISNEDSRLNLYLKEKSFRDLFLTLLVSSNTKFSGAAQQEILGLFHSFGLENDAWGKVKKKSPYSITGGIRELTTMRVNEIIPVLLALLKHPDKQVYQEAQYSLVYFQGFQGLFFLDDLKTPLSDWQQLRLLKSILRIDENESKRISLWLTNKNNSVVIFTLRLIANFQLFTYYDEVFALLKSSSISVRKQVIVTLQALENTETNAGLIAIFDKEDLSIQIEILKMFKISRDKSTKEFLKQILCSNYEAQLQILAAETLRLLGEEDYLRALMIDNSNNLPAQLNLIVEHALQEKK